MFWGSKKFSLERRGNRKEIVRAQSMRESRDRREREVC